MVIGKPNPAMLEAAIAGLDVDPTRCIMVGDRLGTDIQMAVRTGMFSAMPLTGDSTLEEALALEERDRPTFILDRLDRLIPAAQWEELGWTDTDS